MLGLALAGLVTAAAVWRAVWGAFDGIGAVGLDYRTFLDEGHRVLSGGTPYLAYQLAGPYDAAPLAPRLDPATVPFLYPPPFALVTVALLPLPAVLWWAVPLAVLVGSIASWRPAPWSWPLLALALCWPATPSALYVGGTSMWAAALVAAGLRLGWPAALVLLKPSLLPLALVGARRRSWWVALAVLGVVSLACLPLWPQYATVMGNAGRLPIWYSLGDVPLLTLPLVAWAARRGPRRTSRTASGGSSPGGGPPPRPA